MKIIRFWHGDGVAYGVLEGQEVFEFKNTMQNGFKITDISYPLDSIQILAPCEPTKIICVGLNYKDHVIEMDMKFPQEPKFFFKPPSAVIGNDSSIIYPAMSKRVEFEAELAVVIGKITRNIEEKDVFDNILGYTCANDITARDLQKPNDQWTISKSFDTFCPAGPYIVTDISPVGLEITLEKNGIIEQNSNTENMIFSIPYLVSYLSKVMTLHPGDLLLTGTPSGVGPVKIGDKIEVEIEGIGTLENIIV